MKKKNVKRGGSLFKKTLGAVGLGVSLYGIKKFSDLYRDRMEDKESLLNSVEYEEKIKESKDKYLGENGELFNYEKIAFDFNADKLFKSFLEKVEENNEIPDKVFKISDIEKLIPFELSGIENKSTYDYSVMSMLGGQRDRDYFIFKDTIGLRDIFTEESNKPNRDSLLWKRVYNDERFIINPKYYGKKGE